MNFVNLIHRQSILLHYKEAFNPAKILMFLDRELMAGEEKKSFNDTNGIDVEYLTKWCRSTTLYLVFT